MDPLKTKLDALLREEQVELALMCATIILGIRRGIGPCGVSDFNTPWGKAPESKEEEAHQDLVWIHKVLPPNDQFDPEKAKRGFYTKMRWKRQDEFWSEYDPDQKTQRHIPKIFNPRPTPKPKTLKAIRRQLAEGKHV